VAAAVPIGLVVASTLVWQATSAAFVGTTTAPANTWETGEVRLTNDRIATVLFSTASEGLLVPGSSGSKCITVTYNGTVETAATGVRLYGALTSDSSAALAAAMTVKVELSTTALGTAPDLNCSPAFQASPISYASKTFDTFPTTFAGGIGDANADNVGDWRPTPTTDRTRTYRISYSLPASAPSSGLQGQKVGMTFTWEVQSAPGT